MQRRMLRIALPACLSIALVPTAAHAVVAPPGDSSAVAVRVGELLNLSDTGAHAGPGATAAEANIIEVGGQPLLGLGGTQQGPGSTEGSLLDVAPAAVAQAQVAPWEASSTGTAGDEGTSQSRAAVARADVPAIADVDVLEAESHASHRDPRSTARGFSNGVHAGLLGGLDVVLLHSETSSEGTGSSFLAGINDLKLGTDEQLGQICGLQVSPAVSLACLVASGGTTPTGARGADAAVASGHSELLASALDSFGAISTSSTAGDGTLSAIPAAPAPAESPALGGDTIARSLPATDEAGTTLGSPSSLARTGATAMRLAPLGLLFLGVGVVLRRLAALRHRTVV